MALGTSIGEADAQAIIAAGTDLNNASGSRTQPFSVRAGMLFRWVVCARSFFYLLIPIRADPRRNN